MHLHCTPNALLNTPGVPNLQLIKQNPEWAYAYTRCVIKGRWPEAEEIIKQDPEWACHRRTTPN